MFFQTWVKYVPVIRILLKRSVNGDQTLEMNSSDFMRAAGGRKVKFNFSFGLNNGKMRNLESTPPLARDLIGALQEDRVTSQFIKMNQLEFSMNKNFQLIIKNVTPPAEVLQNEKEEQGMEELDKAVDEPATGAGSEK
jgi:hypothetical protein